MATGTTVDEPPQVFGTPQKRKINPDPFAALALLCAVVGAGVSLVGGKAAIARPSVAPWGSCLS